MNDEIKKRAVIKLIEALKSEMLKYKKKAIGSEFKVKTFQKKIEMLKSELTQYKNKRRRSKRITVGYVVELISGSRRYTGFIKTLSEQGLYIITSPTKTVIHFIPGGILWIRFQLPSGETLNLSCRIIWLHTVKTISQGLLNTMGLEIIDPPSKYREFFKTFL